MDLMARSYIVVQQRITNYSGHSEPVSLTSAVSFVNQPKMVFLIGWLGAGFIGAVVKGVFPMIRSYKERWSAEAIIIRFFSTTGAFFADLLLAEECVRVRERVRWMVERRRSSFARTSSKVTRSWLLTVDRDEVDSMRIFSTEILMGLDSSMLDTH